MFAGVGIIGALASLLSSILVGAPSTPQEETPDPALTSTVEQELAVMNQKLTAIEDELTMLSQAMENMSGTDRHKQATEVKD